MADDHRLTWGLILEVLEVMERHGYRRSDNQHTGQAIGLIGDVARIYEGTLDAPPGGYVAVPSSQPTAPQLPGPPAVIVSAAEVKTLLADRPGRSRRIQTRPDRDLRRLRRPVLHHLPVALAGRRRLRPDSWPDEPGRRGLHRPGQRAPGRAALPSGGPQAAADKEAGQ